VLCTINTAGFRHVLNWHITESFLSGTMLKGRSNKPLYGTEDPEFHAGIKAENRQRFEPVPRTNCQENHMRRWTASIWRSRASIEGAAETGIPSRSGVILNATQ